MSSRQLFSAASPRDARIRLALLLAAPPTDQPPVWPEAVPHHSTCRAVSFGLDAGFPQQL